MSDVICSDAFEWAKSMPDKSIDHIITDYEYGTIFPYTEFIRICKGTILTFCSEQDRPFDDNPIKKVYWIKTPSTKNFSQNFGRFVEEIHIFKQEYYVFNTNLHWSNYTGVFTDLVEEKGFYWKKPLSLMERLVRILTGEGELVADPYCGQGTTLQACRNWGRRYIGVDVSKEKVDWCLENIK